MPTKTIDQKIEKLARMTEKGFEDIQKEMATKDDLKAMKKDLHDTEERLLFAIENTEVKKRDFDALADEVEDIEKRVDVLEKTRGA